MLKLRTALFSALILLTPALLSLGGCRTDEEVIEPTAPTSVPFEGETDEAVVGKWESTDGTSKYQFDKDGKFELEQRVSVRGSTQGGKVQGQWKVKGDQLLIKDSSGNVVPYKLEKAKDQLIVSLTGSLKTKTTLKRK